MIADEFSAELAEGVAYVSGHDEESRPVLVKFNLYLFLFCFVFLCVFVCLLNKPHFSLTFCTDFPDQAGLPEVPFTKTVSSKQNPETAQTEFVHLIFFLFLLFFLPENVFFIFHFCTFKVHSLIGFHAGGGH